MADSTNLLDCPQNVDIVASYLDGIYAQPTANWNAFPGKIKVGIVISAGTNAGQVLDIETGDATPNQAGGWAKMRLNSGLSRATLYCNRSNGPAVEASLRAAGLTSSQVALWPATLDGTTGIGVWGNGQPITYPVVAVQYANSAMTGGHYDKSIVYDDTWPPIIAFGSGGGTLGGDLMTPGAKLGWAKIAFCSIYNRQPTAQEEVDFANSLADDGSNFNTLCDGLSVLATTAPDLTPLQASALRADVNKALKQTVVPGPQGLKGDQGIQGIQGVPGTVPDHKHTVGTTSTEVI